MPSDASLIVYKTAYRPMLEENKVICMLKWFTTLILSLAAKELLLSRSVDCFHLLVYRRCELLRFMNGNMFILSVAAPFSKPPGMIIECFEIYRFLYFCKLSTIYWSCHNQNIMMLSNTSMAHTSTTFNLQRYRSSHFAIRWDRNWC